ncbi:hypothetical protein Tco_0408755, partial [Tanacetum coccineum]
VAAALAQDRAIRGKTNGASGSGGNTRGNAGGQGGAPPAHGCSFTGFMKCGPIQFHGNEGAVELCYWFEKTEIATLGLDVVNGKSWTDMRKMMMEELCPDEELALLCPEAVPNEKKKVELYIKGLPENIKGKQLPLGLLCSMKLSE